MVYNPYAPPSRAAEREQPAIVGAQELVLAELGTRVIAKLIDIALLIAITTPGIVLDQADKTSELGVVLLLVGSLGLWVVQSVLISVSGQSLGKRWMGLRVITSKGAKIGFFRGVFLREWVMKAGSTILYGFPLLLDPFIALGKTRQCIHDHLADSLVIVAGSGGDPYR